MGSRELSKLCTSSVFNIKKVINGQMAACMFEQYPQNLLETFPLIWYEEIGMCELFLMSFLDQIWTLCYIFGIYHSHGHCHGHCLYKYIKYIMYSFSV